MVNGGSTISLRRARNVLEAPLRYENCERWSLRY